MQRKVGAALILMGLFVCPAWAEEEQPGTLDYTPKDGLVFETADGDFKFHLSNRVQFRYSYEDPETGEAIGSFRVRRFKFKIDGHAFQHWKYELQVNFASGSVPGENDALLEDAWVQYTKHHWFQPFMGQHKAPLVRERLTSSGKLQFVDRTIISGGGAAEVARQIGVGMAGQDQRKRFEYAVGMYNGDGANSINREENENNEYLFVGRVVWMPFGEYKLDEAPLDRPKSSKLALGLKAAQDTRTDEFDPDDAGPLTPVDVDIDVKAWGAEIAYKLRGYSLVGEWFRREDQLVGADGMGQISLDTADEDLWYLQTGYLFPNNFEVALRYAVIDPHHDAPIDEEREYGVAVSYYLSRHDYKVQADYRELEFDDAGESDSREARLQFQFVF